MSRLFINMVLVFILALSLFPLDTFGGHKKTVLLIRHAKTDMNGKDVNQGQIDTELNSEGLEQARQLAPQLKKYSVEVLLSSDMKRAFQTAEEIAKSLQIPLVGSAGLKGAKAGIMSGVSTDQIRKDFPKEYLLWHSVDPSDGDFSFPGGESRNQVTQRAFQSIDDFFSSHPNIERIGVSSHGSVIRRFVQTVLPPGSPPVKVPNGEVIPLYYDTETRQFSLYFPEQTFEWKKSKVNL